MNTAIIAVNDKTRPGGCVGVVEVADCVFSYIADAKERWNKTCVAVNRKQTIHCCIPWHTAFREKKLRPLAVCASVHLRTRVATEPAVRGHSHHARGGQQAPGEADATETISKQHNNTNDDRISAAGSKELAREPVVSRLVEHFLCIIASFISISISISPPTLGCCCASRA